MSTSLPPYILGNELSKICYFASFSLDKVKNKPAFFSAGRSAIYTITETMVEVTALMEVEATFQASVSSAAGFPKIRSL